MSGGGRFAARQRVAAAALTVCALLCAPVASAAPTSPLCDSGSYRRAHPLICDTGGRSGPFNVGPGGGSGGGGGLLDVIRDVVGGLTGGLL